MFLTGYLRSFPFVFLVGWAGALTPTVSFSESSDDNGKGQGSYWSVKAGLGVYSAPDYTGSDEYDSLVFPSIDISYKDVFFASVIDGVGVNLIRDPTWGVTISGQIVMGREAEGDVESLPGIDDRFMPKLEIHKTMQSVRLHVSVMGDGKRYTSEAGLQRIAQMSERTVYMIGAGARWNNHDWNNERFSLSPSEVADIGLMPYSASSSLSEVYFEGALVYQLSPIYLLETVVEVAELTGDVRDSPLTRDLGTTTQPAIFVRLNRQF